MGTIVSLCIFSLKIYSSKDMTHPEVLVSLLANIATRFTKLYISPANTALTSSYTFFLSPMFSTIGHRHFQHPSHCSRVNPDLTRGKGLITQSSSIQAMICSGMRQPNKLID